MKKMLCILFLLLTLAVALIGCGDDGEDKSNEQTSSGNGTVKYTISWIDEMGNCIVQQSVNEDAVPSYTYVLNDTAEWDYTFVGWSETANGDVISEIPAATKDTSYYAKVTAVKRKYTVTFNTRGGSSIPAQSIEYGAKAAVPENPEYEGHKFMGWSTSASGSDPVDFNKAITGNVEYFAIWNEIIDVKGLLSALLDGYELNPFSYIPETMLSNYSPNLVDANSLVNDYSSFVNVSDISYGHGEQWHMVLENLEQTSLFFNVLSVVETVSTTSISAFNNYFDSNPSDTAHYEFESGIYNVTINFDGEIIYYVLDYTANVSTLGNQTVQIALAMNVESGEKTVRVQLGDANALMYKVLSDSYEFAIKYLGVRRAMFSVSKDTSGAVSGKIYEYLTASSVEIANAAEFYITDEYVSVVGNKASGMIGFTGCITELYNVNNGKMLGYEVQETLSSIVYNTIWFNLDDISDINDIKYQAANGSTKESCFVNGSGNKWEAKKVGGISAKALSRRFDIEFRTQYVYSYNPLTQKFTEHKIEVPMIFVQEECYNTFAADVKTINNVNLTLLITNNDLTKLLSDYDTLIPSFIENKDSITPEFIIEYIKNKITF